MTGDRPSRSHAAATLKSCRIQKYEWEGLDMPLPSAKLRALASVNVGQPYLILEAADSFDALRAATLNLTGIDFLAVLGDCFRAKTFTKNNPGSVTRSLHKCGVAIDYNQGEKALVLVRESIDGRTYWHTYLKITDPAKQVDSEFVALRHLPVTQGGAFNGWALDFTELAASMGWQRIPAQKGWEKKGNWNKREFWHYQYSALAGKGYDFLMGFLYD
ncbi:MAG TPA: hypothetical protein VFX97_07150 [Pyrinomonadaceae bacterium]|nr:hypothetical protein [Pyrinomonadaceae bacterium]